MEDNIVFYRIYHGMYFKPNTKVYGQRNLSKKGKGFPRKPSLSFLSDKYYDYENNLMKVSLDDCGIKVYIETVS